MQISFGNRLSAQSWAGETQALNPNNRLRGDGLDVDLSAVGFADFVVLGRLLVLIDSFASVDSPVQVRLPSPQLLDREIAHLKRIDPGAMSASDVATASRLALRHRQRGSCRLYLEQCGFETALKHWGPDLVTIVESPAPTYQLAELSLFEVERDLEEPIKTPHRRRRILPYRWLKPGANSDELKAEIKSIEAALNGIGLPPRDSEYLAHGLISELVENVHNHAESRTSAALAPLVGLVVLDASVYASRRDDFGPDLRRFLDWSAEIASPIIRVFVGDSGQGFDGQQAMFDAMSRWAPSRSEELPAGGLWKVFRIIKGYGGSLVMTSGGAKAGFVFGYSAEQQTIAPKLRDGLPGTAVECNILAVPARHRPPREIELPWRPVPASPLVPTLGRPVCTTATLRSKAGLDQGDRDKINEILQRMHSDTDGLIIAIDIPRDTNTLDDDELRESIHNVLRLAAHAANPATVSLAFAGANQSLLTLAIEDLNASHDRAPAATEKELDSPVLVIAENVHYWAGGTPELRAILGRLSRASGPLPQSEFTDLLGSGELHQIHQHGAVLQLSDGLLTLKLRPQDVVRAIASYVSENIIEAVEKADGSGVTAGEYLTPTLRFTSRWINARSLLSEMGCLNMAGLLLAFLVDEEVGRLLDGDRPLINLVGTMTRDMATVFGSALAGVDGDFDTIISGSLPSSTGGAAEHRPMIICTDLIRTEHSVRSAISELLAQGASPVGIAALIDARDEVPAGEERHLQVGDHDIPLISLARVSVSAAARPYDDPGLTIIDPILDEPLIRGPAYARTIIPHEKYVEALTRSGGARIGHIKRPADRHYSAYVDPTQLFTDPGWREIALKSMVHRVKAARRKTDNISPGAPICILLPSRTRDAIDEVARLLREALGQAGLTVIDVLRVPRAVGDGDWTYPSSFRVPEQTEHVVVLDAGSRNGRTLRQLIRVASTEPVRAITAIVLANGMDDADAIAFQQIRTVDDIRLPLPGRRSVRSISVDVSYLARTAVKSADAEHCAVCGLQKSYASISLPLTERLSECHQDLLGHLEARSKEELFSNQAIDLLGTPIAQTDCIAYLTWRSRLRDAFFSTVARAEVLDDLRNLQQQEKVLVGAVGQPDAEEATAERDALIRVLAAEAYWLDREPLRFEEARRLITSIAAAVVGDMPAANADPMLRIQAAMVLTRVDPSYFAAEVAAIIHSSADHRLVVAHILLEVMRLVSVDGQSALIVNELARNMSDLERNLTVERPSGPLPSEVGLLADIKFVAAAARLKLPPLVGDSQDAWAALRRHRDSVNKHSYDQPLWRLLVCIENLQDGIPIGDPADALQDWLDCSDGLAKDVLPNLPSLAKYLMSERVTRHFSYWDTARWSEVVAGGGDRLVTDMTVRLRRIFGRPPERIAADPQLVELIADLEWWRRFFFTSWAISEDSTVGEDAAIGENVTAGDDVRRGPILLDVIRRCPTEVQPVIEEIFSRTTYNVVFDNVVDDSSMTIFCTYGLLADTLTHIRRNAEGKHRAVGTAQEFLISVAGNGDVLTITVLNNGSRSGRVSEGPGGLSVLNADLALFGARLDQSVPAKSPWTYEVSITVQRWKGI